MLPDSSKVYRIVSADSGKVLDVSGASTFEGESVIIYDWQNQPNQKWRFTPLPDGCYRICALHSGQCLDVDWGSTHEGAWISQYSFNGAENQRWEISAVEDYVLIKGKESRKFMDVEGSALMNEARVVLYSEHFGASQRWRLEVV